MLNKPIIWVDMDGVLARFYTGMSKEILCEKGYFASLPPQPKVVRAVRNLWVNHPTFVLSAYLADSAYALEEKEKWLKRYLPGVHGIFLPCGTSKAAAVEKIMGRSLRREDILIDDFSRNLFDFSIRGGTAVKLLNGINGTKGTWKGRKTTADSMFEDVEKIIANIVASEQAQNNIVRVARV